MPSRQTFNVYACMAELCIPPAPCFMNRPLRPVDWNGKKSYKLCGEYALALSLNVFFAYSFIVFYLFYLLFSLLQLGVALGFLLPPVLVANHDDLTLVGKDLQLMFYIVAGLTTLLVVLVVFCKYLCYVMKMLGHLVIFDAEIWWWYVFVGGWNEVELEQTVSICRQRWWQMSGGSQGSLVWGFISNTKWTNATLKLVWLEWRK